MISKSSAWHGRFLLSSGRCVPRGIVEAVEQGCHRGNFLCLSSGLIIRDAKEDL